MKTTFPENVSMYLFLTEILKPSPTRHRTKNWSYLANKKYVIEGTIGPEWCFFFSVLAWNTLYVEKTITSWNRLYLSVSFRLLMALRICFDSYPVTFLIHIIGQKHEFRDAEKKIGLRTDQRSDGRTDWLNDGQNPVKRCEDASVINTQVSF